MTLPEFYEPIKNCQKCTLAASRTQVVFGHGNPQAEIVFVGEAQASMKIAKARCSQFYFHADGLRTTLAGATSRVLQQATRRDDWCYASSRTALKKAG